MVTHLQNMAVHKDSECMNKVAELVTTTKAKVPVNTISNSTCKEILTTRVHLKEDMHRDMKAAAATINPTREIKV